MAESASKRTAEWHLISTEQALQEVESTQAEGLSDEEAQRRLHLYGPNEIIEGASKSILRMLWEQLTEPLVLILIFAALISAALGKADSVIAISAIVVLNAILGISQEYRAEKAIAALKKMSAPLVRVRRGGQLETVGSQDLVPGDVVLLEAGNIVPADARVLSSANLRVQEASLTGESYPVDKLTHTLVGDNMPIGDRDNMVYLGTSVAYGRGEAVVTSTGMETELGHIAQLIQGVGNDRSPLQRRMDELGKVMMVAAIVVMGIAFAIGLIAGYPLEEILLTSVAIAVAVVPEGLPAVVTISLALGAQRMLRQRALIRKLPAVETLGSVTVICSDKTGTLTENKMRVKIIDINGNETDITEYTRSNKQPFPIKDGTGLLADPSQKALLLAGTLCNDAILERSTNGFAAQGDPTEGAFVVAAAHFDLTKPDLEGAYPRVGEVPFSSERKRMTTVHKVETENPLADKRRYFYNYLDNYQHVAFSKGAVDSLIDTCTHVWDNGSVEDITPAWRSKIEQSNDRLAQEGLRVLGVAFRPMNELPQNGNWEHIEEKNIFIGMVGIIDPPRPEVRDAVTVCRTAGIRPVMITGDHPLTATAIARELGIMNGNGNVMTGRELNELSEAGLRQAVEEVSVFARVSPEHKLKIVQALQQNGGIVAMTGDGVNDAPALKQADIGVAMGITGTDVSKEASDMVILDDNFASIVNAVEEGRTIYDNVRRFIKYLLASNTGELFVLLMSQLIAGMGLPLTTLQILWMNLITDGIPALALGVERAEKNSMVRPPYEPNASVLGYGLGRHILIVGMTLGITALGLGYWAWDAGLEAANGAPAWNTMVFMMLTLSQMGHVFGLRSHRESFFNMNFFSNRFLLFAVAITIVLQMGAVYLPIFNDIFNTNPLTVGQLILCLALSSVVFVAVEIEKLLMRRGVLS